MYALFPCAGFTVRSPTCTSGKGDPEAKMTEPFVQANASAAEHSALCVGLDIGNIMGFV